MKDWSFKHKVNGKFISFDGLTLDKNLAFSFESIQKPSLDAMRDALLDELHMTIDEFVGKYDLREFEIVLLDNRGYY